MGETDIPLANGNKPKARKLPKKRDADPPSPARCVRQVLHEEHKTFDTKNAQIFCEQGTTDESGQPYAQADGQTPQSQKANARTQTFVNFGDFLRSTPPARRANLKKRPFADSPPPKREN